MKIVEQSFSFEYPITSEDWLREARLIENAGRTSHKSEDKITDSSYTSFIKKLFMLKHDSVFEFGNMVVRFVTTRSVTHELVRHRLCSFIQESQRYVDYSKDKFGKEITFVKPIQFVNENSEEYAIWFYGCKEAEERYFDMLKIGVSAQNARSILPNSAKTEIVVKTNWREWALIFKQRAISRAAHPDMRALMIPLYQECRKQCPEVFDMGEPE